jgi:hypothetical protein
MSTPKRWQLVLLILGPSRTKRLAQWLRKRRSQQVTCRRCYGKKTSEGQDEDPEATEDQDNVDSLYKTKRVNRLEEG